MSAPFGGLDLAQLGYQLEDSAPVALVGAARDLPADQADFCRMGQLLQRHPTAAVNPISSITVEGFEVPWRLSG